MTEITQRQKYDLKRKIEELKSCKGKHTELYHYMYLQPNRFLMSTPILRMNIPNLKI